MPIPTLINSKSVPGANSRVIEPDNGPVSGEIVKRGFDILFAMVASLLLLPPLALIALLVKISSRGPVIHWSERVGRHNVMFQMPKFRTMRTEAPPVAKHLLTDADSFVTPLGRLLRLYSLDELPQLWSIIKGDMSFVGPRPALFNQEDLVALRNARGVQNLLPGLTGWAQVNGRDRLPNEAKADMDLYYLQHRSFGFDLRILWLTVPRLFRTGDVLH